MGESTSVVLQMWLERFYAMVLKMKQYQSLPVWGHLGIPNLMLNVICTGGLKTYSVFACSHTLSVWTWRWDVSNEHMGVQYIKNLFVCLFVCFIELWYPLLTHVMAPAKVNGIKEVSIPMSVMLPHEVLHALATARDAKIVFDSIMLGNRQPLEIESFWKHIRTLPPWRKHPDLQNESQDWGRLVSPSIPCGWSRNISRRWTLHLLIF